MKITECLVMKNSISMFHKMAGYYGREEELNGKVRAAMTYPVILFSITVLAAVFMLTRCV